MTPDRNGTPLFGRRQLLLGGGTFLAGAVGIAAWTKTHSGDGNGAARPATSTSSPRSSTPQTEVISIEPVLPVQATV